MNEPNSVSMNEESVCGGCKWSVILRSKMVPHPGQMADRARENPLFCAPPTIYVQENYCTNLVFTGGRAAVNMGNIVACERFDPR